MNRLLSKYNRLLLEPHRPLQKFHRKSMTTFEFPSTQINAQRQKHNFLGGGKNSPTSEMQEIMELENVAIAR